MENGKSHNLSMFKSCIKAVDDRELKKELMKLDQITLYIVLLKTFGYGTEEIGKLLWNETKYSICKNEASKKKIKKIFCLTSYFGFEEGG